MHATNQFALYNSQLSASLASQPGAPCSKAATARQATPDKIPRKKEYPSMRALSAWQIANVAAFDAKSRNQIFAHNPCHSARDRVACHHGKSPGTNMVRWTAL
ncbi:unnamed protein product [Zymoseptoria tritici ST99CH_3D7]|uniref:Uncharacterized protein n=1 Tax=Zymoseptoria tritici (strain ST99CH_3D7) TaxID=1276538 RepID=A0A1X7RT65_ZYMT9|nr:unnamed protein product [Zymoseptoria tritici ST99CH_3D7]